jgi:hypothetical protein
MTSLEKHLKHHKKNPPRRGGGSTDKIPASGVYHG